MKKAIIFMCKWDCAKPTYFNSVNEPPSQTKPTWDSWPSQYVDNYRKRSNWNLDPKTHFPSLSHMSLSVT